MATAAALFEQEAGPVQQIMARVPRKRHEPEHAEPGHATQAVVTWDQALAGDPRFRSLVEAVARLASPTGQWPEAIHPQTKGGCMGDGQHVWAAAEWIMMLRNCLLYEQVSPPRLVIGMGAWPQWLEQQRRLSIGPAPTRWGSVQLCIDPAGASVEVHWHADWFRASPEIEVKLPGCRPVLASAGGGQCAGTARRVIPHVRVFSLSGAQKEAGSRQGVVHVHTPRRSAGFHRALLGQLVIAVRLTSPAGPTV